MSYTTFVGQNWGAGQTGRAREGVRTATVIVLGVAVLCWFRRMERMTTGRKPPENRKE